MKRLDIGAIKAIALADVVGMRGGTWRKDGTILFAKGTVGPLLRLPSSGGEPVPVGGLAAGQSNHRFPIFLPDGRRFLYFALGTPETQGIYLSSLDSREATRLTPARRRFRAADHRGGRRDRGDIRSPKHLASWMGACLGNEESASVNYSHRCPKGNRQMRRVFNQAANAAVKAKGTIFNVVYAGSCLDSVMRRPSAPSRTGDVD